MKNVKLRIKNDGMPGNAGQSGGGPAAVLFKMTFLAVTAECWQKNGRGCYPVIDCIPLIQLFLRVFGQFRLFEWIFRKRPELF
jgi:hypothetical protein